MSTHKTKIDQEVVASFLREHFSAGSSNLTFISGGESSQAFHFTAKGEDFVIRVNKQPDNFKKDEYAYKHFASAEIPIPKILEIGQMGELYFAISERVQGKWVQDLSKEEYERVLPQLLSILDAIHTIDIATTKGYGGWDAEGRGEFNSWKKYIPSLKKWVAAQKGEKSIFEKTFLEKDVWQKIYKRIMELIEFCPEERHLIHGDYGYNNVLSDGKIITGVLDWEGSKYGDLLYDIAWMNFWSDSISLDVDFVRAFKEYCSKKGITFDRFKERILCYELHIGLGALSFYAFSEQRGKYDYAKVKLLGLMKQS